MSTTGTAKTPLFNQCKAREEEKQKSLNLTYGKINKSISYSLVRPQIRDKLYLTCNKMYINPVLSEIKEENKSDNSWHKSNENLSEEVAVKINSISDTYQYVKNKKNISDSSKNGKFFIGYFYSKLVEFCLNFL